MVLGESTLGWFWPTEPELDGYQYPDNDWIGEAETLQKQERIKILIQAQQVEQGKIQPDEDNNDMTTSPEKQEFIY